MRKAVVFKLFTRMLAGVAIAAAVSLDAAHFNEVRGQASAGAAQRRAGRHSRKKRAAKRHKTTMSQRIPADAPQGRPLAAGTWGGEHISLESTAGTTRLEFDCAHATIPRPLELDDAGHFDERGEYVRERGGPLREGQRPESHPARFSGTIRGGEMTLTVTLTDTGAEIGTFNLGRGREPLITKCL
ncbi:MAG: hypothetical protein ABW250_14565 [Pyrinomonadaceae bacterium]